VPSKTPIVTIHRGASSPLRYVLHQARALGAAWPAFLIGDAEAAEPDFPLIPLDNVESSLGREFEAAYQHMSTNREGFELFCWKRWFHLQEFMRQNDLGQVIHIDSDVLLYSNPEQLEQAFGGFKRGALLVPDRDYNTLTWCASGHVSYWTRPLLDEFCTFAMETYQTASGLARYREKWNWHLQSGARGGICDMTGLYLFWYERQDQFNNLAMNHEGNCVDLSIRHSSNGLRHEYRTQNGRKEVQMIDGQPHFVTRADSQLVRVHALHFQGPAKPLVRQYYTGPHFAGQRRLEAKLVITLAAARLRHGVKQQIRALAGVPVLQPVDEEV
jgi:hypothetical protein